MLQLPHLRYKLYISFNALKGSTMTATQPDSQTASSAPVSPASPEEKASVSKAKAPVKKAVTKKPTATARKSTTDAAVATPAKPITPITPKPLKAKKTKLVRDSFTIPKLEYLVLEELKDRAVLLASPVKKTELLRAGIKALAAMADASFLAALKAVPVIKTGRPTKD